MRFITARAHGWIDLIAILVFVLGPLLFGLGGEPAAISYSLAALHLLLTLLTRFPMGIVKAIPFFAHGIVELVVGVALVILPTYAGYSPGSPARRFYTVVGAALLVVWVLTDYGRRTDANV